LYDIFFLWVFADKCLVCRIKLASLVHFGHDDLDIVIAVILVKQVQSDVRFRKYSNIVPHCIAEVVIFCHQYQSVERIVVLCIDNRSREHAERAI
jgi:hypothetical protein